MHGISRVTENKGQGAGQQAVTGNGRKQVGRTVEAARQGIQTRGSGSCQRLSPRKTVLDFLFSVIIRVLWQEKRSRMTCNTRRMSGEGRQEEG